MAKYIPEVTIENETYLLKDSEARESIEQMDEIDKVLDGRTNELLGLVNYGYDTASIKSITSGLPFTLSRNKTILKFDGTTVSNYNTRIKINNEISRVNTATNVRAFTNGTFLIPGHTYRVRLKKLSGSCTVDNIEIVPTVSIYVKGTATTIGYSITGDRSKEFVREFVADDSEYMVSIYLEKSSTFNNFVFSVTLQDMTIYNMRDYENLKATVVEQTIDTSSSVATFTDGADNMPMTVKAEIGYEQELNEYEYPWLPSNGKNVFPNEWNDTGTSEAAWRSLSFPVDLNTNENYTFSNFDGVHKEYICAYDANDTFLGRTTGGARTTQTVNKNSFTSDIPSGGADPDTIDHLRIHMYDWSGVTKEDLIALNIQCEIGDTATAYEPYSNTCPITGHDEVNIIHTSKNLFTQSKANWVARKSIDNSGNIFDHDSYKYSDTYFSINGGADIVVQATIETATSVGTLLAEYNGNKEFIRRDSIISAGGQTAGDTYATLKTDANCRYFRIIMPRLYPVTNVMVSYGTTPSTYADVDNIYNIDFSYAAGTVYGGELTVYKNGTGSLVKTWYGHVFDGTETIVLNGSGTSLFARYNLPSDYPKPYTTTHADRNAATKSSHSRIGSVNTSTTGFSQGIWYNSSYLYIGTRTRDIVAGQTVEEFKAYLAAQYAAGTPVTVIYKCVPTDPIYISAPQVRTLLGLNHISCDTGNILEVNYPADTKNYIDDTKDTVDGIISTVETPVAKENHAVGDVFICGDKLYRATDAIATGETIAEGTNVASTITIGSDQVPLTLTNYIKSILLDVNSIGSDVGYLKSKVTDPDEAMTKNLYIQNGTCTYDYRTVEMKDGVVHFSKTSSSGSAYKSIWITGTTMAGGDGNQNTSKPPVGNAVAISTLDNINAVRVHLDKVSGSGYINVNIAYCTVDGDTVTLAGDKQIFGGGAGTYDYAAYLNIPETATHYAIQVYSSTTTTCVFNAYIRFSKELEASATGVSF